MNIVIQTGNLGDDPKSIFTSEGAQIVNFPLAFRSSKDKTGWIRVTCFKKMAEVAEKYLHKGARVIVTGLLDQEKWETKEREKKSTFKIIANAIEFVKTDGRGFENGKQPESFVPGDDIPF